MRILGIELRRTNARWAALGFALVLGLLSTAEVGRGLGAIANVQRQMLFLLIPLALAAGAWMARREHRSRMVELIGTTPRPQSQRLLVIATALGIGGFAGAWLAFGGLAVNAAALGGYLPPTALIHSVVTSLYIVAALWFGLAIGRVLPWALTPALLAVLGLVGFFMSESLHEAPRRTPVGSEIFLLPNFAQGIGEFETLRPEVIQAQVLWVIALAAAGLILYATSRYALLAILLPAALVAGVVLPLLPPGPGTSVAVTIDRGAIALVCTPDTPKICVRRVHHRALDGLREPAREALAILAAKLPQAPTTVVERVPYVQPTPRPQADTIHAFVWTNTLGGMQFSREDALWQLLMGAGTHSCEAASTRNPREYQIAELVAAAWLLDKEPIPPSHTPDWFGGLPDQSATVPVYQKLRAFPAEEQRARVADMRASLLACGPRDPVDILIAQP